MTSENCRQIFGKTPKCTGNLWMVPIPKTRPQPVTVNHGPDKLTFKANGLPAVTIPSKQETIIYSPHERKKFVEKADQKPGNPAQRLFIYACYAKVLGLLKTLPNVRAAKVSKCRLTRNTGGYTFDWETSLTLKDGTRLRWIIQEGGAKPNGHPPRLMVMAANNELRFSPADFYGVPINKTNGRFAVRLQTRVDRHRAAYLKQKSAVDTWLKTIKRALKRTKTKHGAISHRIFAYPGVPKQSFEIEIALNSRNPIMIKATSDKNSPHKMEWHNVAEIEHIQIHPKFAIHGERQQMKNQKAALSSALRERETFKPFQAALSALNIPFIEPELVLWSIQNPKKTK